MAYSARGNCYAHLDKFDLARQDIQKAIELDSLQPEFIQNRAMLFYTMGKLDSAGMDLATVQRLGGVVDSTFYLKYDASIRELEMKIKECSERIRQGKDLTSSYNIRGVAFFTLGNLRQAVRDFSEALKLDPDNQNYLINRLAGYQAQSLFDSAFFDYRTAGQYGYPIDSLVLEHLREMADDQKKSP